MKTTIGVFDQRARAEAIAAFARRAGVPADRVRVLDHTSPPETWIEPAARPITMRTVISFTILGVAVFGLFGIFAAVAAVLAMNTPTGTAALIFGVFVTIGLLSGLFMGWVKGSSDADSDIQHFRELFLQGSALAIVESDKYAKMTRSKMREEHARMVFVSNPPQRMKAQVATEVPAAALAH